MEFSRYRFKYALRCCNKAEEKIKAEKHANELSEQDNVSLLK